MVPINLVAVLLAAVAQFIIGFLWHGPLFGKQWMAVTGITPTEEERKNMLKPMALGFLGSLVIAFILAHTIVFATSYTNTSGALAGMEGGFWGWLGFVAPVTMNLVLWERFSWKRWMFANAYHLVCFLTMGAIIGYMM